MTTSCPRDERSPARPSCSRQDCSGVAGYWPRTAIGALKHRFQAKSQSCPWVWLTHGLGWVGAGSPITLCSTDNALEGPLLNCAGAWNTGTECRNAGSRRRTERERGGGVSEDRYRIVVMGAAAVGKTCIITRLLYESFVTEYRAGHVTDPVRVT